MKNYFIIKENSLSVGIFPINKSDFGLFPNIDGSMIFNENNKYDEECLCSICQSNFEISDKVKIFDCCGNKIHFECFNIFYDNCVNNFKDYFMEIKCPFCRKNIVNNIKTKCTLDIRNPNKYFVTKKYKDPIYLDENQDINIRLKLFMSKDYYNLDYFLSYKYLYKNPFNIIDVIYIISSFSYFGDYNKDCHAKIISILQQKNFYSVNTILNILNNYIIRVSYDLKYNNISNIKPMEKYIETYCVKFLIDSNKKNFEINLEQFLNSQDSHLWFSLVNIKDKNNIYNLISKKIGEKFRKIIVKNTHKESYQSFVDYKTKFDKTYLRHINY